MTWVVLAVVVSSLLALGLTFWASVRLRNRIGAVPERAELQALTAPLSARDRWRVMQTVNKGRAVADPRLAPAAVARARYVRAYGERVRGSRLLSAMPVFGVLWACFGVARLVFAGDVPDVMVGAGALVGGAGLATNRWQWRRVGRRVERAEELNRRLLPGGRAGGYRRA